MKRLFLMLLLTSATAANAQFFAKRSGGMGNGGHPYEMEFRQAVKQVIKILKDEAIYKHPELEDINLYMLELNSEIMSVEVKSRTLKDKFGRIKCALNFPGENLVQINEECWEKINNKAHMKLPFVLHEMLGLSQEEVDHYQRSSKLRTSIDEFLKTLFEEIPPKDPRFKAFLKRNGSIREIGEVTQESIAYYFDFKGNFGLREHQYKRLDVLCENMGYRFHIDVKAEISNYLIRSLMVDEGSLSLSETANVDRLLTSVTCAR